MHSEGKPCERTWVRWVRNPLAEMGLQLNHNICSTRTGVTTILVHWSQMENKGASFMDSLLISSHSWVVHFLSLHEQKQNRIAPSLTKIFFRNYFLATLHALPQWLSFYVQTWLNLSGHWKRWCYSCAKNFTINYNKEQLVLSLEKNRFLNFTILIGLQLYHDNLVSMLKCPVWMFRSVIGFSSMTLKYIDLFSNFFVMSIQYNKSN